MIREEFLTSVTNQNLYYSRICKDICVILAGYSRLNMSILQMLDRYKVHYEMLLSESIELSSGIVKSDKSIITNYTLDCETKTIGITGISMNLRITANQKQNFSRIISPPIGQLSSLFDKQIALSIKANELTNSFYEFIEKIYFDCVSFKAVYLPICLMECFMGQVADYKEATANFIKQKLYTEKNRYEIKHACYLKGELDGFYERQTIEKLNLLISAEEFNIEQYRNILKESIEDCLAAKVKVTALPLTLDYLYRTSQFQQ